MSEDPLKRVAPMPSATPQPPGHEVTVDNCEREPIHIPGAIQPHGALIAFDATTSIIRHASSNLKEWLSPGPLPFKGRTLKSLIDPDSWTRVERAASAMSAGAVRHEVIAIRACAVDRIADRLEGIVHRHRGISILELERAAVGECDWLQVHNDVINVFRGTVDLEELLGQMTVQVRRFTGFDRVMVYRFDADWHGEVVAESRAPELEPYLGLHYPASDIPAQARELYRTNLVRYIADVDYAPVDVVPLIDPERQEPLDLSYAVSRSVSPMHLRYLKNMGVTSTLTLSLVVDGKLWGLIACHHHEPTALSLRLRQTAAALAIGASYLVSWHEQRLRLIASQEAASGGSRIFARFNHADAPLRDVVDSASAALLKLVGATGGALWQRGDRITFGNWPLAPRGEQLFDFAERLLSSQDGDLHALDVLDLTPPLAPAELKLVCGMMVIRLGKFADAGLIWLRPEHRREVTWGGDPDKPVQVELDASGQPMLTPRASFERWSELVKGRCRAWSELDRDSVRLLLPLRQMLAVRESLMEVRTSDRRFRALVDLQSDAYWQTDHEGRLVTLSKTLPFDVAVVEGQTLLSLFEPVCAPESLGALREALASGGAFRDVRLVSRVQEAPGEFELLLSGDPLRDHRMVVQGLHGTLTNITQMVLTGREIRRREAAEASSQLKSRFLSQVSHELRTPLNAVLGFSELLLTDAEATPSQHMQAEQIHQAGTWLLAMVSDLLDLGRIEAGEIGLQLQPTALADVMEQATSVLQPDADAAGVKLLIDQPPLALAAVADPTRLRQVLMNLISNAIKYNRRDGDVRVFAEKDAGGKRVRICVADTGVGMTPDQLSHLFEPFNRLGRENLAATPGAGIGLVITKQLVTAMKGSIQVSSEVGVGSCFTVELATAPDGTLPASGQDLPLPSPEQINEGAVVARGSARGKVLYVGDDRANAELLRSIVSASTPAEFTLAGRTEEGLAIALREQPAVMFIDLNLPGQGGVWLLGKVREHPDLRDVHCIFLNADIVPDTLAGQHATGFDQNWRGPIDLRWAGSALNAALLATTRPRRRPPARFDMPDALAALSGATAELLDTFDFGVIGMDAETRVTVYNLAESRLSGCLPAAMMGRRFFEEVGVCMNNPLVAGRLAGDGDLDTVVNYTFRLGLWVRQVQLRLLRSPSSPTRFILVKTLDAG